MAYMRSRQTQQILTLQADLGLTRQEMAGYFGTSWRSTPARYRTPSATGRAYQARRRELSELAAILRETFRSRDAIRTWMRTRNQYLGGLTPAEVVRAGRIDRVKAAVGALESGIYV